MTVFYSKDQPIFTELTNGTSDYNNTTTTLRSYNHNADNYPHSPKSPIQNGNASPTVYYTSSRRSSVHSESPQEVSPAHVKFVRDTSKYWYKPTISREEGMLRDQKFKNNQKLFTNCLTTTWKRLWNISKHKHGRLLRQPI